MVKITIFKPNGEHFDITDPIRYETEGPLLTAMYASNKGEVSIRTTLPYYFEQGEDVTTTAFKPQVWP